MNHECGLSSIRIVAVDHTLYFWDPSNKRYIPIPYRDRWRPPTSRWEVQAAVKRLKAEGYARVDEVLIFQAIQEMRTVEQESERRTKKARRARELRDNPPRQSALDLLNDVQRFLPVPPLTSAALDRE